MGKAQCMLSTSYHSVDSDFCVSSCLHARHFLPRSLLAQGDITLHCNDDLTRLSNGCVVPVRFSIKFLTEWSFWHTHASYCFAVETCDLVSAYELPCSQDAVTFAFHFVLCLCCFLGLPGMLLPPPMLLTSRQGTAPTFGLFGPHYEMKSHLWWFITPADTDWSRT